MIEVIIAVFIGMWLSGAAYLAYSRLQKEYGELESCAEINGQNKTGEVE